MKGLECRQLPHWAVPRLGVVIDEMNEADAVCELENGIPESGGPNSVELGKRISDELLVVRCLIGLHRVSHNVLRHATTFLGAL
jgi:hypothetical protein